MVKTKTTTWDIHAVHDLVRARHHFYRDEITRLMKVEHRLLPLAGDGLRDQLAALTQRIEIVERNGGDATTIRAEKSTLEAQRAEHSPALAEVEEQLRRARECAKWADMAHDGMHWLCFAEPRYVELTNESRGCAP